MSQTLLGTLRRRLRALRRSPPRDSPANSPAVPAAASLRPDGGDQVDREDEEHLRDVPDGAGCTEIWEHLSERQATETGDRADD